MDDNRFGTLPARPRSNGYTDPTSQLPLHASRAERAYLGCVILKPETLRSMPVRIDQFYSYRHRLIYDAALTLRENAGSLDEVVLAEYLNRAGKLEEAGGMQYLVELMESVPHAAHADSYAKQIIETWRVRTVRQKMLDVLKQIERGDDVDAVIGTLDFSELQASASKQRFETLSAKELESGDFTAKYHIPHILAEGIPTIASGAFKTLKTSIFAADMCLALATGAPFLGRFEVSRPYRVAVFSGESGLSALQDIFIRAARHKGLELDQVGNLLISPDLPQLSDPSDLAHIERFIVQNRIEVLVLDPAYLCLDLDDGANNLFRVGRQLCPLFNVGRRTGCTVVVVHHNTKSSASKFEPAELSDIQWAGFAEAAGQWMLLSRREKYDPDSGEHKLWLNVGGRTGHAGLWALDICEGRQDSPRGRCWTVDVKSASEARNDAVLHRTQVRVKEREKDREIQLQADMEAIRKAVVKFRAGETRTAIREESHLRSKRFQPALDGLLRAGEIEPCTVKKGNRTYDAIRPSGRTRTHPDATAASGRPDGTQQERDALPCKGSVRPTAPTSARPANDDNSVESSRCPDDGEAGERFQKLSPGNRGSTP